MAALVKSASPVIEIGEIMRRHGPELLAEEGWRLTWAQRRVLRVLPLCRTAQLGGHVYGCVACGGRQVAYNSCRNRHCPKCQGGRTAAWLEREASWLLPVEYYHVVFTLPGEVAELGLSSPQVVYDVLLKSARDALAEVAAEPRYLGAEVGAVAVLHTWGQTLQHHPHVHVIVTGGGLACDARGRRVEPARWVSCRPGFFLPVRVLSVVYRRRLVQLLGRAHAAGKLHLSGRWQALTEPSSFAAWLALWARRDWVVYAKAPFAGPEAMLKYLARYTHRVAISNQRLLAFEHGQVTFSYKDYARGGQQRQMTLPGAAFVRRFLQHVLPRGFVKVRHFGLWGNRRRQSNLECCRRLLGIIAVAKALSATTVEPASWARRCPECGSAMLVVLAELPRAEHGGAAVVVSADTS